MDIIGILVLYTRELRHPSALYKRTDYNIPEEKF